ncbi:alkane 1-monooxygenase [Thalassotalea agarivorans]|uniref:Alkane 1-monooxygenase n=1 Tax=Thalassotalea agarivorans TaxID=349064 RepID=A0A1I0B3I8_THASX|nr:alkane 1-monooxygenase [Thalassotalea agarivorans]SET01289.1 alkane 1-monooxygenase [Thalassotalea agarivorans]
MALLHFCKFLSIHVVGLFSLVAILMGGQFISWGLLAVVLFYVLGDMLFGEDTSTAEVKFPNLYTLQLWLALPILSLLVFSFIWSVSAGDALGFGQWLGVQFNYDFITAKINTDTAHHVSGLVLTGLMIGLLGTITAHELVHRTWDKFSTIVGRWLLAFSFDSNFSIEHIYGHHRYVATENDPATAPRGRNVYAHIIISTIKGNVSAWRIEAKRLMGKKIAVFSYQNRAIRGYLMSVVLLVIAYFIGGIVALLYFVACALWAKALLEIVNYMEHYGLIRAPKNRVQPYHSWNTNRRLSSWTTFNLTRHSHHHAQGRVPYHDLQPYHDAPMMPAGYLTTIIIAMVPPLWHRIMTPKVLEWDNSFANEAEKIMAEQANVTCGLKGFTNADSN